MKFTDIVRDHYRGPAYGQEFTTWYTKVQHGFSTAQVPESAQVDHLVAVLDSPAQELAFSFIKKYNAEHPTEGLRGQQLVQYHEDKLAALVAHLQSKSTLQKGGHHGVLFSSTTSPMVAEMTGRTPDYLP